MARLNVRVQPGASRDELRLESGCLRARLAAPAVEGKANKRLIELLARALAVPRSRLAIVHGETSRNKVVEVSSLDEAELSHRLEPLAGAGTAPASLPFPESLCHKCDAPARYVRTRTSVFILCPRLPQRYPRQPVLRCPGFRPLSEPLPGLSSD